MINKILKFTDLHFGEENKQKVLETVKSNISFRGSNLWILACAIVVASIGLNVNSTAVIIGAMLISPLMGPIIGAGFGLGIYDFALLKKSLKNLLIATIVGLIVSTMYFYLSPFKETQSELLSRTSPNIYDLLIAFFGGLVGVIAITRIEKGNPIPGVAIATALMPPLCTAGYGLAIGNLKFFFGALFLYAINCVFIGISTFLIVKYLKYPAVKQVNDKRQKQVKYGISILIVALMLPSIYFAYMLYNQKQYNQKIDLFIKNEFENKGYTVLYKKVDLNKSPKKIELAFLSKKLNKEDIKMLNQTLNDNYIKNAVLKIRQDTTDIKRLILNQIHSEKSDLNAKDIKISQLENEIAANKYNNKALLEEIKIIFPEVENISISNHTYNKNTDSSYVHPVLIYKSKNNLTEPSKQKLQMWLQKRLSKEKIEIYRQETI
ncbi:TIGR00341 family protein [Flavobacterium soyangense]|uniref:TIGR00341 family protein n=1 Tax=Flavobacterium soyangense TaxID=2023265 RepID=A0A930U5F5_9FLAO|nr:TIGR00341 family protein [Flavobacterium soyangense]MBF2707166.1 TIGR00341 family protein [Flavobacterium soyangense]